jgi:hypothetical protein
MRLSRWSLALFGFALTLALAWAGVTADTLIKELHSETRITRIEGVIGLGQRHRSRPKRQLQANSKKSRSWKWEVMPLNPTSHAGKPPPPPKGGEQGGVKPQKKGPTEHPAPVPGGSPQEPQAPSSQPSASGGEQAETGSSAGGDEEASTTEDHSVAEAAGHVLESTGEAVTGVLCGATDRLQLQTNC